MSCIVRAREYDEACHWSGQVLERLLLGVNRRLPPQRAERVLDRCATTLERTRPRTCRRMVAEAIDERTAGVLAAPRRAMAMPDRHRQARAPSEHAVEALRVRARVLTRRQRLDVIPSVRAALGPQARLSRLVKAWQYRMLSVVG